MSWRRCRLSSSKDCHCTVLVVNETHEDQLDGFEYTVSNAAANEDGAVGWGDDLGELGNSEYDSDVALDNRTRDLALKAAESRYLMGERVGARPLVKLLVVLICAFLAASS